jgi:glycosyltransferase involved in cell wall biosynthesis
LRKALVGLQHAHHDTRVRTDAAVAHEQRLHDLERQALIATTSAWLRQVEIPETMLVSVVTPTRNRSARLSEAMASVIAQRYQRWELLVVDDGSDDDTWDVATKAAAIDERIRPLRIEHKGVSAARNHALEHAAGDVIAYLDDDNCFDPDWLGAVVWAFTDESSCRVVYGARIVDDPGPLPRDANRGPAPRLQFVDWNAVITEQWNRLDVNVFAHRPSAARFDEALSYFADRDLLLRLTDDTEPVDLPVVATYSTTSR